MYFIGIDIGTSSICGAAYDSESKKVETVTKSNTANIATVNTWEKMQDPEEILTVVSDILQSFTAKYPDIKGIGFTGQMHGILYTDRDGNTVSPLYTWQDGRGNRVYKGDKTYAAFLSETTGYPVASGYGLVTHSYNRINGLVPAAAVKLCTIMDYAVMRFSGRKAPLIDYSNAAALGFFDSEQLCFDREAIMQAGIDTSILPETAASGFLAGYYKDIPVYSAIGDNQAAFMGSVREPRKSIHITVGTSSQISVFSEKYTKVEALDTRPFPGGGYILVGAALCGGQSFQILKTFFEDTLKFFAGESCAGKRDLYSAMTSIAYEAGEQDTLVVQTLFDGTRANPRKRGTIANISTTNLTPEGLILGFLNGISRELYDFYTLIPEKIRKDKTLLIGSGNGIKKNSLLCKAFEDRFGLRLHLSEHQEEAALGACICAMRSQGLMMC